MHSRVRDLKLFRFCCSYQKTESALKTTAEKTSSIFGGITSGLSSRLSQMKKSDSYKTLEEKVGSAYENVKVTLRFEKWIQ